MHTTIKSLMRSSLLAALMLAAILSTAACGRKSDIIPPGTVLPAAVADLSAECREGMVILSWTSPGRNTRGEPLTGLSGFVVMRASGDLSGEGCMCEFSQVADIDLEVPEDALVRGNRVAWTDRDPAAGPGMRYAYKVAAYNSDGYYGPDSYEVRLTLLSPPNPPEPVTATVGDGSVLLGWRASDKNARYNVYRTDANGVPAGNPANIEPVASASFMDTGLTNNDEYFYRVTALYISPFEGEPYSEGAATAVVSATPADVTPPDAPDGLRAVPGDGFVLLSWLPSTAQDIAGYVLYRRAGSDATPVKLAELAGMGITYKDTGVTPGVEYAYTVAAFDTAKPRNESAPSGAATAAVRTAGD